MPKYEFDLILAGHPELTLELSDALFAAGCDDASPSSTEGVTRVTFHRDAESLEMAIRSAVADVQTAGCTAERLEIEAGSELLRA